MSNMESELEQLMFRFAADLDGAVIGRGPRHPVRPRGHVEAEIDRFLAEYPVLRRDAGYVEFLETYAGATADSPDGLIVVIFGFDPDVGLHMTQDEGPLVDDDGFLAFATVQVRIVEGPTGVHEYLDMGFSYDVTGARPPGVYRSLGMEPSAWFCEDFQHWLRLVVERHGRLENAE
jgi:hypothetical protein